VLPAMHERPASVDGSNEQKVGTIQQNPRSSPDDQQAGRQRAARFSSQAPAQIGKIHKA